MPNVSTRQTPRRRLDTLWEKVVDEQDITLLQEDEVADKDLEKYQIQCIYCDFEGLDDEDANLSLKPPILFQPRPPDVLKSHPIDLHAMGDATEQARQLKFRDYNLNPPTDPEELHRGFRTTYHCARRVFRHLYAWACGFPRVGVPLTFLELYEMNLVSYPNRLLSESKGLHGINTAHHKKWDTVQMLEYDKDDLRIYPHVILMTVQSCNGKDGSILFGELASIITAMRNRANQCKIYEDEDGEVLVTQELEFKKEERFPVLMVSLLGPQHGRLFYACMDGGNLVIRQSKLFSFERKDSAPWDFFSRVILSRPLEE